MSLASFYHHLTFHIVAGPQSISYLVPFILLPLALSIPRSLLSRWQNVCIFIPVITACIIHAWIQMNGVDVISVDTLLWSLDLIALKDPWTEFRRIRIASRTDNTGSDDPDKTAQLQKTSHRTKSIDDYEEESYPSHPWRRLEWIGTLLISIRLENWRVGIPSHDSRQPSRQAFPNRSIFVRQALISFTCGYIILDLTSAYTHYDPYFNDHGVAIGSRLPTKNVLIPPRVFRSLIIGSQAWALIGQMFYLPCLLPVSLNAMGVLPDEWSPHNWGHYFGPFHSAFSSGVRGFWGRYWHQTMRYTVSIPGLALADAMGLQAGAVTRYAVVAFVAFGCSGLSHMGLVPPEPPHATMSANQVRLLVGGFFWVQPVGMLLEVVTSKLVDRVMGWSTLHNPVGHRLQTAVSLCWMVVWFSLCIPLVGEMGRQLGYWRVWIVPVSLWKGITEGVWIAWP